MRGVVITVVAATVVVLATYGLVVTEQRAGPVDAEMQPVDVPVEVSGTYQARSDPSVGGVCVLPPCEAVTAIDARFQGLPQARYEARLEGATSTPLGDLVQEGADFRLRWSEQADHTDKQRIVVLLAGRAIALVPVAPSDEPASIDERLPASWGAAPAAAHLNEIGGITVSTVASAHVREAVPAGWVLQGYFFGDAGCIGLGALETSDDGARLDARVERTGIEDQDALVIALVPTTQTAGCGAGFPILRLDLR